MNLSPSRLLVWWFEDQPVAFWVRDDKSRRGLIASRLPLRGCRLVLVRDQYGRIEAVATSNCVQAGVVEEVEDLEIFELALG